MDGLHRHIYQSVLKCDVDHRKELYHNVILAGGNTMFEGLSERLWFELKNLVPSQTKLKVISPPDRKFSAWIGGAILSALSTFQTMWITKQEYDESGPAIIHRKCF